MEWVPEVSGAPTWPTPIAHEQEKAALAATMAERLGEGDVVGVGSGSTSFLTLVALAERARRHAWRFVAITTSLEMSEACARLGVDTTSLLARRPDWSFDGADEIDPARNMIKGRGGAMLRERLVMASSPERYVVVDATKKVARLGAAHSVPLEVVPEALALVRSRLEATRGVTGATLRLARAKDGPVVSEHGNLIVDLTCDEVDEDLEHRLGALPGVVATGLFFGFSPEVVTTP